MLKPDDPRDLAMNLLHRSVCNVQVGAVVVDGYGKIMGWGWNHSGPTGLGLCAERHAIRRCNADRLHGAVMVVAGRWRKTGKIVTARPCAKCQAVLRKKGMLAMYRNQDGKWEVL